MTTPHLFRFLAGTLRGRLILSVAAVHAVMMTLFITDLAMREREMLLDRQVDGAEELAQSLATSSAGWIAAADIAGLQEIVEAQRRHSELCFVIFTNAQGLVLAHTDPSRRGQYVLDLPREAKETMLSRSPALVDVAVPVLLAGRCVGWVRVGIGQQVSREELAKIIWNGVGYALAAILIGSAIAWWMGDRITSRLYEIQNTIDAVRSGDRGARSHISGTDEAASMAKEFNSLLDTLEERDQAIRLDLTRLEESERRIKQQLQELQRWHDVTLDRENRVLELKQEVNQLLARLGETARYGCRIPEAVLPTIPVTEKNRPPDAEALVRNTTPGTPK